MKKRTAWMVGVALVASAAAITGAVVLGAPDAPPPPPPTIAVVPQPVAVQGVRGDAFELAPDARIVLDADPMEAGEVARAARHAVARCSAFELPIVRGEPEPGDIALVLGEERHPRATEPRDTCCTPIRTAFASARTRRPVLWNGTQTLRQLLPAAIESGQPLADPLEVVAVEITEYPRFAYRSAMLDVARHFFTIEEVERYIDEIAMLKINTLHIHLSNYQRSLI